MSRIDPYFKLRLPDHLRVELEKVADANRRSLTAEILGRLEASLSSVNERLAELELLTRDRYHGNETLEKRVVLIEQYLGLYSGGTPMVIGSSREKIEEISSPNALFKKVNAKE